MKELKEEAKRHHEAKLHKYGASEEERKACGGSMKRAHGGKVEHPHKEHDKHLAKEIKHEAEELEHDHEKKHGGHVKHHRADGGPISGGAGPKLGRGRKGKGKPNIAISIGKPGGDSAGAPPMMPPPALGAGPSMPPKPMMPPPSAAGPAGLPPRPGLGVKHGGKVEHKKHHGEHEKKHEHKRHHEHRGHSGHRG